MEKKVYFPLFCSSVLSAVILKVAGSSPHLPTLRWRPLQKGAAERKTFIFLNIIHLINLFWVTPLFYKQLSSCFIQNMHLLNTTAPMEVHKLISK